MAVALGESGWEMLRRSLIREQCTIPAPVLTELQLATSQRGERVAEAAAELVAALVTKGATIAAFQQRHADITDIARQRYGKGNGRGGKLNFGDLMVYAVATERGEPLLFTGNDFSSTDVLIHPSSRID